MNKNIVYTISFHNLTTLNQNILQFIALTCLSLGMKKAIHFYRTH